MKDFSMNLFFMFACFSFTLPMNIAFASERDSGAFLKACVEANGQIINDGTAEVNLSRESGKEVFTCPK